MLRRLLAAALLIAAGTTAARAQERQWTLDVSDTDAYLVFGVAQTDDVGVSFWCAVHSGEIKLFVPEAGNRVKPDRSVPMRVVAGGKTFRFTGKTTANQEAATISLEAPVAAGHPLFAALKATDRFTITVRGETTIFPLADADIAGLIGDCRKP